MITNVSFAKVTLDATPTDVYTTPALTTSVLLAISICNTSAVTRAITILLGTFHLLDEYALLAKETLSLTLPHVLDAAETINASADAGTDVDLIASGVEIT